MNTSTPTPADAVREAVHGLSTLEVSPEEIAADAIRVAADALLPRPAIGDQSLLADRDRLLRLQFLELANELAGNPPPAASPAPESAGVGDYEWKDIGDGRPVQVQRCHKCGVCPSNVDDCGCFGDSRCPYFGTDAMASPASAAPPAPETPAEALAARPLLEQVAAMGDCVGFHTVGQITAISARAAAWLGENPSGQPVAIEPRGCPTPGACSCVEPATSAPALPPALVFDGGNEVKIEATNRERSSWAVRSSSGGCLNRDLSWEPEPMPSNRDHDFLARYRWPSVEEAYAALLDSRAWAAEEVQS